MNNIKLTKYYKEPNNKYDVVSVVAFRLKDNYKSSMIYYTGLKRLVEMMPKHLSGIYLRIYYDDSIIKPQHNNRDIDNEIINYWIPLFEQIKTHKHVQLTHYDCPQFKIKGSIYHDGLFGTVVRFIPLFDYLDNNNIGTVIISDIDSPNIILENSKNQLEFMKMNNTFVHYRTGSCYSSMPRYDLFTDEYIKNFPQMILGGNIVTKIKFPHEILDDFLVIMKNLNVKGNDILKRFIENERKSIYKSLDVNMESIFVYGIDEYILAKYIAEYIVVNKIPYSYTIYNGLERALYSWYLRSDNFKDNAKYIDIMKQLLGKYYDDTKTVAENYNILDKIIYKTTSPDKVYIYNNIFKVFKELEIDKTYEKYDLRWRDINCVNLYPYTETQMVVGRF
ncbi:hypothetical protein QKU48_gp1293 [Fadolivirus algeromassiliense]|jgi:hypothetical protein|uniref:Uncharacterized protein n=1 Tax=Fadolivirus FV1/VV64 TaxID=3070911 RepID=A0A7D3UVD8_9VIRU|nr:hypothetical protein QKU48_gp1293 [Fadolivirus algeromassiliense]QKF94751.1 hypothetical protein Fadolivirus_1_1293 [Fadolivirus FV1/VV64]